MEWIIYSSFMFCFSILQYLILRKLQKEGVPAIINNLMLFLPGVPLLLMILLFAGKSLLLSLPILIFILVITYLFSYLGNINSVKGIQNAPNSGYSLIIQKSYAIYTTFAAAILFASPITVKSLLAIAIVLGFAILILFEKPKQGDKFNFDKKWIVPSLLAFFLFGNLALASKWLLNQGIDPIVRTFYVGLFVSIMYSYTTIKDFKKKKFVMPKLKPMLIIMMFVMGASNALFNAFMQLAMDKAPNIGLVNIVITASIVPITLLSVVFFKEKLNLQKIIGMIGVLIGVILLVI